MADIFHTFFGICGLSLLGYFVEDPQYSQYQPINPTFALPDNIVKKLGLKPHVFPELVIKEDEVP